MGQWRQPTMTHVSIKVQSHYVQLNLPTLSPEKRHDVTFLTQVINNHWSERSEAVNSVRVYIIVCSLAVWQLNIVIKHTIITTFHFQTVYLCFYWPTKQGHAPGWIKVSSYLWIQLEIAAEHEMHEKWTGNEANIHATKPQTCSCCECFEMHQTPLRSAAFFTLFPGEKAT